MATMASTLLRAARNASLASRRSRAAAAASSRSAAAAACRAAAMASRSARSAGLAAAYARAARSGSGGIRRPLKSCPARGDASTKPRDDAPRRSSSRAEDYEHLPVIDDAMTPTDKDFESDEALWALYERWCKALNKERDHAEMARRFKLFKNSAELVHRWNTAVPADPEEAAIYLQKRREVEILLSKGEDVSDFDECYLPMELGLLADGGDPFLRQYDKNILKAIEDREAHSAVKDVTDTLV